MTAAAHWQARQKASLGRGEEGRSPSAGRKAASSISVPMLTADSADRGLCEVYDQRTGLKWIPHLGNLVTVMRLTSHRTELTL